MEISESKKNHAIKKRLSCFYILPETYSLKASVTLQRSKKTNYLLPVSSVTLFTSTQTSFPDR